MKFLSASEYKAKYAKKKKNKYNAKKTTVDGKAFPSKAEATVYSLFRTRELAGDVGGITRYKTFYLSEAKISYKPDWVYVDYVSGTTRVVEVKGVVTDRFRLIKKLWKAYGLYPLEIWKVNHRGPYLDEVITPGLDQ